MSMKSRRFGAFRPVAWSAAALLSLCQPVAQAETTSYTVMGEHLVHLHDARGTNLTIVGYTDVMARLSKANGFESLVAAILAASPTVKDAGVDRPVTASDFDHRSSFGIRATWYGGLALMRYLNSIAYAGSTRWRLPTTNEVNKMSLEDSSPFRAGNVFKVSTGVTRSVSAIWVDAPAPAGMAFVRSQGSGFNSDKAVAREVVPVSPGLAPTVSLWSEERAAGYMPEQTVVLDGTDGASMRAYRCKALPEGDGCQAAAYRPSSPYGGYAWARLGF